MRTVEQALYVSTQKGFGCATNDFTRLYYGAEFCERLLPTAADLDAAIAFAAGRAMAFTFMTPFVTDAGLDALERLLEVLAASLPEAEVVVNDWGVLHLVRTEHPGLTPVLGRLLNKSKRGPRIMQILEQVPPETKAYFQGTNLDVPAAARFLGQQGIGRVEFDNLLQGLCLDGADPHIRRSLYLPYAVVSATRFCLTASCDDPDKMAAVGVFPCGRQCLRYSFNLYNPVMTRPLVRRGNAIFFVNETIPDIVARQQVDRIVVQPEIPY